MRNCHLVADIWDKVGEPIKSVLGPDTILNELMTTLDAMNLELIQSGKGQASYKVAATLAADVRTGIITDTDATGEYEEVWVLDATGGGPVPIYTPLPIYTDFQDLVAAEERGEWAIMFMGLKSGSYQINFTPTADIAIELWGKKVTFTITQKNFELENALPDLYESLAVYRAAYKVLDYLLLPTIKLDYGRFVTARKKSMEIEWSTFEDRWLVYLTAIPDDGTILQRRTYDPIEDMRTW